MNRGTRRGILGRLLGGDDGEFFALNDGSRDGGVQQCGEDEDARADLLPSGNFIETRPRFLDFVVDLNLPSHTVRGLA